MRMLVLAIVGIAVAAADADLILFSPQDEHMAVMDHILGKLAASSTDRV